MSKSLQNALTAPCRPKRRALFKRASVTSLRPTSYRSVWISDVHLGTEDCKAGALLAFLANFRAEHIYLVGDFIDVSRLENRWYWPRSHAEVVDAIRRHISNGARVTYVAGNHDANPEGFAGLSLTGVAFVRDAIHLAADGRRLLVIHGDGFDTNMHYFSWLTAAGNNAENWLLTLREALREALLRINAQLVPAQLIYSKMALESLRYPAFIARRQGAGASNATQAGPTIAPQGRIACERPTYSATSDGMGKFAQLMRRVKIAAFHIGKFQMGLTSEARRRGVAGVVCGHVHHPEIREVDGIAYCNCGDWVSSCTALVEHVSGKLELVGGPSSELVSFDALAA